jgi:hypothetical protein
MGANKEQRHAMAEDRKTKACCEGGHKEQRYRGNRGMLWLRTEETKARCEG